MASIISQQSQKGYHNNRFYILGAQYLLLAFLMIGAVGYMLFQPDAASVVYYLCLIFLCSYIWSLWSWKILTSSLFDPYVLFLTAAVIFNGGQALLEIFGLNEGGILAGRFSEETILRSLLLVTLGLAAFHFGALISTKPMRKVRYKKPSRRLHLRHIRLIGWALLSISAIPTLIVLQNAVQVSQSGGYFALYQQQTTTGFGASVNILATFLVPGALFLLAGSKGRIFYLFVSGLVIVSYTTIQFLLGFRSDAAMALLAYAWLWHEAIRPLPKSLLLIGGSGLLFFIFPFIKAIRSLTGTAWLNPVAWWEAFSAVDNPVVAILSELGFSLYTVVNTLELVPSIRSFDWGTSYFYAMTTVFPNLFWDVHPIIAHGLAATWLVQTIAPSLASIGGGYGFSFIAEAYLNFGWFGSPIVLGLIGFLFARFVLWAKGSNEPAKLALVASFTAFFLIYARGEAGSVVRYLFWYAVSPYLLVLFLSKLGILLRVRNNG